MKSSAPQSLNAFEYAVCRAIAEAMYPSRESQWPSYEEAKVLEEIDHYLQGVVPQKRRMIRLLLTFTELAAMLKPPFRRFTHLTPDQRLRLLNGWDSGRSAFLNLCSTSLRMLFNLAYLSNASVRDKIGEGDRTECHENVLPRRFAKKSDGTVEGVMEFAQLSGRTLREEVDFVVIGSGPGGAVVAHELAEAGRSVIVLEEGQFYRPEENPIHALRTLRNVYAEQGLRFTKGNTPIRTMQARALGGTSVVNSAITWRAPQRVFDHWQRDFGIEGISRATLDPFYAKAEIAINAHPTEEKIWGEKGILFRNGCAGVGVSSAPTTRAAKECNGCSQCFYGCRRNAKQSMDRTYIPAAIEHGARFYTSCRAEELIVENKRVAGVRAAIIDPSTRQISGSIEVRAQATIIAAGAMASPILLLKNSLPYHSPAIGKNLSFHNGYAVAGVYDHDVEPWRGATQDWHSEAYLPEIHMEVLWVNSALLTARTRGFGVSFNRTLEELRRTAFWCISICGSSRGEVRANRSWEPSLRFSLNEADAQLLKRGADHLAEHFLASGAKIVRTGMGGLGEITNKAQMEELRRYKPRPEQMIVGGNHVFGTCAMGSDPRSSVVDSNHRVHGVEDLYICDTSVFPAQSEVNPQLTLMAMAGRLGSSLITR